MAERDDDSAIRNIIGYGLSKFAGMTKGKNNFALALGYRKRVDFFRYLVEQGIVITTSSMKNYQDSFDSFFENANVGWKTPDKIKQYTKIKSRIDSVLGDLIMDEYATFVKQLISYSTSPETLDKKAKDHLHDVILAIAKKDDDEPAGERSAAVKDLSPKKFKPKVPMQNVVHIENEVRLHTEIQQLLMELGRIANCGVFIATNDRRRINRQQPIDGGCISDLPHEGLSDEAYRRASLIDVIWLEKNRIVCAFEVEVSTSIYSGILRMSDLMYATPYSDIKCYIVVPEKRMKQVKEQLQRPTFSNGITNRRMEYVSAEELRDLFEHIMPFGHRQRGITWEILASIVHAATD